VGFLTNEQQRAYWAAPKSKEARIRYNKRYGASAKGRAAQTRSRKRHLDRIAARNAVNNAIAAGTLIRLPCVKCGKKAEAHHHKGYARKDWLDVQFLCPKHHEEAENDLA
jgi:hypothetical protein